MGVGSADVKGAAGGSRCARVRQCNDGCLWKRIVSEGGRRPKRRGLDLPRLAVVIVRRLSPASGSGKGGYRSLGSSEVDPRGSREG